MIKLNVLPKNKWLPTDISSNLSLKTLRGGSLKSKVLWYISLENEFLYWRKSLRLYYVSKYQVLLRVGSITQYFTEYLQAQNIFPFKCSSFEIQPSWGTLMFPGTQFWKVLYKIFHFSHILYIVDTPSYAQLHTNNELACPPVFIHEILSVWNPSHPWETPHHPCWIATSSAITSPPFPFSRWNKCLLWKLPLLCRYFLYHIWHWSSYLGRKLGA